MCKMNPIELHHHIVWDFSLIFQLVLDHRESLRIGSIVKHSISVVVRLVSAFIPHRKITVSVNSTDNSDGGGALAVVGVCEVYSDNVVCIIHNHNVMEMTVTVYHQLHHHYSVKPLISTVAGTNN